MYGNPSYDWNKYYDNVAPSVSMPQSFHFPNQLNVNQQFFPRFFAPQIPQASVKREASSMINNYTNNNIAANFHNFPRPGSYNFNNNLCNSFPSPPLLRQFSAPSVLGKAGLPASVNQHEPVESGCFQAQPKFAPNNQKMSEPESAQNSTGFEIPASRVPALNAPQPATQTSLSDIFVSSQPLCRQLFKPDLQAQCLDNSATEKFWSSPDFKSDTPSLSTATTNTLTSALALSQEKNLNDLLESPWSSKNKLGEATFGIPGNKAGLIKNNSHVLNSTSNVAMPHVGTSRGHVMSFARPLVPYSGAGAGAGVSSLPRAGDLPMHTHIFPLFQQSSGNPSMGISTKPVLPLPKGPTPQAIQTCLGSSSDDKENIHPPGSLKGTTSLTGNDVTAADIDTINSLATEVVQNPAEGSLLPKGDLVSAKSKKTRTTFTKRQKEVLAFHFSQKQYLGLVDRANLAIELNLSEKQIKIWFQNQRSKLRKEFAQGGEHMQDLQTQEYPKDFCKNSHMQNIPPYACAQSITLAPDEEESREHEQEDAQDHFRGSNKHLHPAPSNACHKTQQQMLDEIAEEEKRQMINAARALAHKQPLQQLAQNVATDNTFENNPLIIDCPSV